jgi:hypothetical protein
MNILNKIKVILLNKKKNDFIFSNFSKREYAQDIK